MREEEREGKYGGKKEIFARSGPESRTAMDIFRWILVLERYLLILKASQTAEISYASKKIYR